MAAILRDRWHVHTCLVHVLGIRRAMACGFVLANPMRE